MIRKKRDLSPDAKLRFPDYLGYFFGAGTNIAGYIVSAFLLIYYSNVLYLGLTQVGVVMAISKCFDGVSDILMGRIIDKTKSKYGKARPWYHGYQVKRNRRSHEYDFQYSFYNSGYEFLYENL